MKDSPPSEEELMLAYANGERRAFELLFGQVAPRIHRFFARSVGDPQVADDLLQITFLKLHKARAQYRPELPFRPWLLTIAARVRLDELRRRYRLPENCDLELLDHADEARHAISGDSQLADLKEQVRLALDRLPETQRIVVYLHRYEGLTFSEIARVLGATESAVKLRAFRAYESLRKQLHGLVTKVEAA